MAVAWASWVAGWVLAGVAIALNETPASIRVAREMLVKRDLVVLFIKLTSQLCCADSRILYGTARFDIPLPKGEGILDSQGFQ